jgi:uncharacterized protein
MILFLSFFLVVYGGMHWFFYRLLTAAWSPGRLRAPVLFFLALMVLTPPLVRILEHREAELTARALAHIGYSWMGFVFLFCVMALLLFGLWLPFRWRRKAARLRLPGDGGARRLRLSAPARIFWLALLAALAASAYGYREATDIHLEEVRLVSPKLAGFAPARLGLSAGLATVLADHALQEVDDAGSRGDAASGPDPEALVPWPLGRPLRIVKITDLHLGLILREKRLAPILEVVRQARPDILVATGDIVDGQSYGLAHLAEKFRRIEAPLGKFAILGNHEFYIGAEESRLFLEDAGFTVLRGESVEIGGRLRIAGVDDRTGISLGLVAPDQEERLLASLMPDRYNILLKHQPEIVAGGSVDLQLSGHVHGGQIFPFKLFTWLAYRVPMGLSRAGDGRYLYVGRGTGTWGPPIRFLAPPEITLFELAAEMR